MANEKNLKPMSERTPSERREIAKKGGKASGKARRQKKQMAEILNEFLEMPIKEGPLTKVNSLSKINRASNILVKEAIMLAAIKRSINGDPQSTRLVLEMLDAYQIKNDDRNPDSLSSALENLAEELNEE